MNLKKINKGYIIAFATIILVVFDQIVKMLVHANLEVGEVIPVFKWFNLCYVENPGFAYGMQLGGEWGKIVLSLFRLVMIGAIIYGIYKLLKRGNVPTGIFVGAVLILAGAIGNMVDCMFYGWLLDSQDAGFLMGDVIDMIHLPLFKWENCPSFLNFLVGQDGYFFGAVFNVADAYISIAVVYLLLFHYEFFSDDKKVTADEPIPDSMRPSSGLALAIIATMIFTFPFGLVSLLHAVKVDKYWEAGMRYEAIKHARSAKYWGTLGIIFGVILLIVLFQAVGAILSLYINMW